MGYKYAAIFNGWLNYEFDRTNKFKLVEVNDLELILFINEARVDEDTEHDINEILENAPSTKYNPIISDDKCNK